MDYQATSLLGEEDKKELAQILSDFAQRKGLGQEGVMIELKFGNVTEEPQPAPARSGQQAFRLSFCPPEQCPPVGRWVMM